MTSTNAALFRSIPAAKRTPKTAPALARLESASERLARRFIAAARPASWRLQARRARRRGQARYWRAGIFARRANGDSGGVAIDPISRDVCEAMTGGVDLTFAPSSSWAHAANGKSRLLLDGGFCSRPRDPDMGKHACYARGLQCWHQITISLARRVRIRIDQMREPSGVSSRRADDVLAGGKFAQNPLILGVERPQRLTSAHFLGISSRANKSVRNRLEGRRFI